jgi:hypothetical protein
MFFWDLPAFYQEVKSRARHGWFVLIILATLEMELGRPWLKASPGKKLAKPHLNK